MAIFKKKEEKKEDKKETKKSPAKKVESKKEKEVEVPTGNKDFSWVLRKPRITEKSAISAEKRTYVFEVDSRATKKDISAAVKESYKVTPEKVNIAKVPHKKVTRRTKAGVTSGKKSTRKKAYVYLKEGDSINFV